MSHYTYKEVISSDGFSQAVKEWEEKTGRKFGYEADYDGDIHEVSAFLINKLQSKIKEYEKDKRFRS